MFYKIESNTEMEALHLQSSCLSFNIHFFEFNAEKNGFLGFITDKKNEMQFVFRPAKNIKSSRTVIVLHGHGSNGDFSKFSDENWNVIVPLDKFGTEGKGSWWIGENGDFKTYHLLQNLIKAIRAHFGFSSLYFWGSSMGGYGAIVHGFELGALAIYAHIPQTKLKNTKYTDGSNSVFYHPIINDEDSIYLDLNRFIAKRKVDKSPVLFLSQNSKDAQHFVEQHFLSFLMASVKKGFAISVSMPLISGHVGHMSVAKTVKEIFEPNYRKIKNWRVNGEV